MGLPVYTRTLDDRFVETWYEIRADAIDNILEANIVWMALKEHGCFTPQVGGEMITRTIRYGKKSTQNVGKGSILSQNETKLKTMARWDWKYFVADINRSLMDDQKNSGKFKIKDYVADRLEAARDACVDDSDDKFFGMAEDDTTGLQFNGLFDAVGCYDASSTGGSSTNTYATGTSNGEINRTNTWWRNWAFKASQTKNFTNKLGPTNAPYSLNLVSDMRAHFNMISNNQASPNFILTSEDLFEAYEDEVADKQQIVRTAFDQKAADLGFETLTFKGATITWSSKFSASYNEALYLNLDFIEFVYDPNVWFDLTNWKETTNQLERVAYIVCACQLINSQPRRSGYAIWAS